MLQTDERSLQVIFSAALAALISYLGVVAIPVTVLMAAMIIDYVTGMAAAWHNKKLSSKKGLSGIIKKISYLALVCVGMGVDWLIYSGLKQVGIIDLNYTIFFGLLVTIWLIINELISILENLGSIGVPLPMFLIKIVKRLKVTTENITESESEKHD
jgi:toxin secretion/phage lysis holin